MKAPLSTQTSTAQDAPAATPCESDLTALLTAWELAHPTATDPEWRHLLDELAHPHTTQAFHRLATAAP
ncbi:hypothetical protein [Streptomyces ureilyticus]|uniref:2-oxoglutarate dehydrogenase E1 component N-terminal domain-containing protein n=1 Tax=Streptomyces ureilyticus TaxID=1775131 RepID=A0ABX0DUK6_9ACTN|nr:hypothetical protein [Streptomyces ureilyticus]NGO42826.1 hypothetical protein [Streptomyces ureilyticus]